jgi:hypothetical protein
MAHRRAYLTRQGDRPDDIDDVSTPVFAYSVLDFCGVRLAGKGSYR